MPALRKVYGPFNPTPTTTRIKVGGQHKDTTVSVTFHFFGIRDDHTMAAWELRFAVKDRKYHAISVPIGDVGGSKARDIVPNIRKAEVVHKEMFIKGEHLPLETGKIADILRKKLKPEHIAMCTALAIKR